MFLMVLLGFSSSVDVLNGLLRLCVPERGKTEVGFLFVLPVTFFGGAGKDRVVLNVHFHNEMNILRGWHYFQLIFAGHCLR